MYIYDNYLYDNIQIYIYIYIYIYDSFNILFESLYGNMLHD